MKTSFLALGLLMATLHAGQPYFQQHVSYDITVKLDDEHHTLSARESLVYTNHSPDTLSFIWFHLWPNAYRNNESAFAKQKFSQGSTRFYFSSEEERGYIDSLDFQINGQSLSWEFHPEWNDVARVHLPAPLAPGDSVTITTPFFVKLPVVFSRLGHTGKHYEITQWYPKPAVYDRYGWHPMPYLDMGEFYSEFGSFDVTITLPKEYRIMATGVLVDGEEEYAWLDSLSQVADSLFALDKKAFKQAMKSLQGGRKRSSKSESGDERERQWKTLHFHQDRVHDFAWFADPKWLVRKGELWLEDSTRRVTLWSMFLPKNAELWENSVEYLHDAGYWYSKFYGPYPYQHITAVDGDLSAGGGMEYPNITVISSGGSKDLLEMVIMHEVGHNWVYGILGSNERDHAWMDEGLNEYTNIRYWEKKYPDRNRAIQFSETLQEKWHIAEHVRMDWAMNYLGYISRALPGDDQPIELTSSRFDRANYGSIIYGKTAIFSRYFQEIVGEDVINQIYHDYYETWKFKHPYPEDFAAIVRTHVPEGVDWYLKDVFQTTNTVDYAVRSLGQGRARLINYGSLAPPVPLAAYDREGQLLEQRILPGFTGEQEVAVPASTARIALDPAQRLPDLNLDNNFSRHPLKVQFLFDQPDYSRRMVYWLPWLFGYNTYNRLPVGVMVYSGMVPGYDYGISLVPLYDYVHQTMAGFGTVKKT
ncbi:MAG: M1 family peptidase, partial [Candidatus Neomarinimicrobiota bacterium]